MRPLSVCKALVITVAIVLLSACSAFSQSQKSQPDATIKGSVRWKGRGVGNISVFIWTGSSVDVPQFAKPVKTDQDGNFSQTVPAGNYFVWVVAKAFYVVVDGKLSLRPINLSLDGGEVVDGVNFNLERGGVITGKATAEGRPVIDVGVVLLPLKPVNSTFGLTPATWNAVETDDRGIYRFYGVPPGEYRVAVDGLTQFSAMKGRLASPRTFYPDAVDEAKGKIVVVEEAKEVTEIDIKLALSQPVFTIRGSIVDAETGFNVPNVRVGLSIYAGEQRTGGHSGSDFSNARGQFEIENVPPGRYALFTVSSFSNIGDEYSGESKKFEVIDQDVEALVVKTTRSATVSGAAMLEGKIGSDAVSDLRALSLVAMTIPKSAGRTSFKVFQLESDGTFAVRGLTPGTLSFNVVSFSGDEQSRLKVLRVEHNDNSEPIEVKSGANIAGVKLIFVEANSGLRGRVKFKDGSAYVASSASATLYLGQKPIGWTAIDARGNFLIENVPTGSYRLVVNLTMTNVDPVSTHNEQTIDLSEGQVSEIVVWLDPKPLPQPIVNPSPP
jgi:hypothetical protein